MVEDDFKFLEENIHILIKICKVKGVCHESVAKQIFGQFVYGKHVEALSDLALKVLAMQEMAKPAEEGQVGNYGACWINHPDFLETEQAKYEAQVHQEKEKMEAKLIEEARKELEASQRLIKQMDKELKQAELAEGKNKLALELLEKFTDNFNAFTVALGPHGDVDNFKGWTWKKENLPIMKAAYDVYVTAVPQEEGEASRSSKIYPKKVLLVDALQQSFMAIARV
jgi:hypothetical protein